MRLRAAFVAGKADGGDPGGALVDQEAEQEQMQYDGRGSVSWAAAECCDWFADRVDACSS